jgi:hypothetical protein
MRTLVLPLYMVASLATGCIVYEEELIYEDDVPGADGVPDPNGEDPEAYTVWLEPAGGVPGETAIVSMMAEGDIDLTAVEDVAFFGDGAIEILATDGRTPNEFLLTLQIPDSAALGANDMVVEFADGSAVFVEIAFTVVARGEDVPDGSPGGDGSGEDGAGDDSGCD